MNKRISSRAIILEDGKLLTMFRRKTKEDGSVIEYYTIPGGGQEEGETLEETVIREVNEEFGIDVEVFGYLGKEEQDTRIDYYYHCGITRGIAKLGGEEKDRMTESNYYEVKYLDLKDLSTTDINAKDKIKDAIKGVYKNFE